MTNRLERWTQFASAALTGASGRKDLAINELTRWASEAADRMMEAYDRRTQPPSPPETPTPEVEWFRSDWLFRPKPCWRTDPSPTTSIYLYDDLYWHVVTSFKGQIKHGPEGEITTIVAANTEPAPDLETAKSNALSAYHAYQAFMETHGGKHVAQGDMDRMLKALNNRLRGRTVHTAPVYDAAFFDKPSKPRTKP